MIWFLMISDLQRKGFWSSLILQIAEHKNSTFSIWMWVFKLGFNLNLGFYIRLLLAFNTSFNFIWKKKCFEVYCFKIKCIRKDYRLKQMLHPYFVYAAGIEHICVATIHVYCDDWPLASHPRAVWWEL